MKVEDSLQAAQMTLSNVQNQKQENYSQEHKVEINNNVIGQKAKNYDSISIAEKTVIEAIERANKKLSGVMAEFEFSIHEKQSKFQ